MRNDNFIPYGELNFLLLFLYFEFIRLVFVFLVYFIALLNFFISSKSFVAKCQLVIYIHKPITK